MESGNGSLQSISPKMAPGIAMQIYQVDDMQNPHLWDIIMTRSIVKSPNFHKVPTFSSGLLMVVLFFDMNYSLYQLISFCLLSPVYLALMFV